MNAIQSSKEQDSKLNESQKTKQASTKRRYILVDYDLRKELLKMINEESLTIKAAAKRLGINYSNAKNIFKVYKKEHRIAKLPKKPNLILKEVTAPLYVQNHIPFRAALLPFYDPNEAQKFLNWNKNKVIDEGTRQDHKVNSDLNTGSRVDTEEQVITPKTNSCIFDFKIYSSKISYKFSLFLT